MKNIQTLATGDYLVQERNFKSMKLDKLLVIYKNNSLLYKRI